VAGCLCRMGCTHGTAPRLRISTQANLGSRREDHQRNTSPPHPPTAHEDGFRIPTPHRCSFCTSAWTLSLFFLRSRHGAVPAPHPIVLLPCQIVLICPERSPATDALINKDRPLPLARCWPHSHSLRYVTASRRVHDIVSFSFQASNMRRRCRSPNQI
jgi:hypothetical protein